MKEEECKPGTSVMISKDSDFYGQTPPNTMGIIIRPDGYVSPTVGQFYTVKFENNYINSYPASDLVPVIITNWREVLK